MVFLILGSGMAVLVGQVGSLLLVLLAQRSRARRDPLDAAAAAVGRALSQQDQPDDGSRFWQRKGRLDTADAVVDALSRASIPHADLAVLRCVVGDDNSEWNRVRHVALLRVGRAYEGEFLASSTVNHSSERTLPWWERRSAAISGALGLGTALGVLSHHVGDSRLIGGSPPRAVWLRRVL